MRCIVVGNEFVLRSDPTWSQVLDEIKGVGGYHTDQQLRGKGGEDTKIQVVRLQDNNSQPHEGDICIHYITTRKNGSYGCNRPDCKFRHPPDCEGALQQGWGKYKVTICK